MTTFAMVFGMVPLVIASGAGAAGRRAMGLTLFTGLSIGTLFTLFVVPAVYLLIGADHGHERRAAVDTTPHLPPAPATPG
jgi:multidrug efflux pump